MDYKKDYLCGSNKFNKVKIVTGGKYNYQTFRVCKKCGTLKLLECYYNKNTNEYQDEWIKQD